MENGPTFEKAKPKIITKVELTGSTLRQTSPNSLTNRMPANLQARVNTSQCESSSDEQDDLEANKVLVTGEIDQNKVIYDLHELKPFSRQGLFFLKRDHIRFGYRANPDMTFVKCTRTMAQCHCETGNIWTHFVVAIYFIYHLCLIFNHGISPENPYNRFKEEESLTSLKIGCSSIIFCLLASAGYHLYSALGQYWSDLLLRIDLVGIGVMIFTLTLTSVYTAFYNHTTARDGAMATMVLICLCNFVVQMTPCYARDEFENYRIVFYVAVLAICLGLAIAWYFYIATENETSLFAGRLFLSFLCLGIGFGFYASKFPEKRFKRSRFVQIYF